MTSNGMRSFAGGLIAAASLCAIVYFFSPGEASSTGKKDAVSNAEALEQLSDEEMITKLASEGYIIQTEEEWNKWNAQLIDVEEGKTNNDEAAAEKIVYRTMLSVSSGMTSIDVGKALEQAKTIDNARDFFNEVEKRGLANDLRPGMYEIESDMTLEEIITVIFKK